LEAFALFCRPLLNVQIRTFCAIGLPASNATIHILRLQEHRLVCISTSISQVVNPVNRIKNYKWVFIKELILDAGQCLHRLMDVVSRF